MLRFKFCTEHRFYSSFLSFIDFFIKYVNTSNILLTKRLLYKRHYIIIIFSILQNLIVVNFLMNLSRNYFSGKYLKTKRTQMNSICAMSILYSKN